MMNAISSSPDNEYYLIVGKSTSNIHSYQELTRRRVREREYINAINAAQLVETLALANQRIDHICAEINSVYSTAASIDIKLGRGTLVSDLKYWDTYGQLPVCRVDQMSIDNMHLSYDLRDLLCLFKAQNKEIERKVKLQQLQEDDWLVGLSDMGTPYLASYHPKYGGQVIDTFYYIRMVDAVRCQVCGTIVRRSELTRHQLHPECNIRHDTQNAEQAGLIKMPDLHTALAVREAGVKNQVVATRYDIYAPAWVLEAIKTYQSNQGYADMSLAEFLRKMDPDRE
jgi:hypothetical protein